MFEWHPFTISSAPEEPNYFTVHIRGVGHWTNKLYDHFKRIHEKNKSKRRQHRVSRVSIQMESDENIFGSQLQVNIFSIKNPLNS